MPLGDGGGRRVAQEPLLPLGKPLVAAELGLELPDLSLLLLCNLGLPAHVPLEIFVVLARLLVFQAPLLFGHAQDLVVGAQSVVGAMQLNGRVPQDGDILVGQARRSLGAADPIEGVLRNLSFVV